MAEAYGFGLPGNQKQLVIENYGILNKRNAPTRRTATLGTRNVLFFCDYYTYVAMIHWILCDCNIYVCIAEALLCSLEINDVICNGQK